MIELTKRADGSSGIAVSVDGVELDPASIRVSSYSGGLRLEIRRKAWEPMRAQHLLDVPNDLVEMRFDPRGKRLPEIRLIPVFLWSEGNVSLSIRVGFSVHSWKRPWSMGELRSEIRAITREPSSKMLWDDSSPLMSLVSFAVRTAEFDHSASFGELIDQWSLEAESIVKEAERRLAANLKSDSLVALFEFPREVRGACEQYLVFFADFLRTLGIEAHSDITHDAGRALFSVTPETGIDALAQIREALDIYLELPLTQNWGDLSLIRDPRIQQLQATVEHLKSQVKFADAILQLKDATIQQLNTAVRSVALTPEVLQSSLRLVASSEDNGDEELLDGVVKLRKYEGKGFQIDLPELYRRFKQRFLGSRNEQQAGPALLDNRE